MAAKLGDETAGTTQTWQAPEDGAGASRRVSHDSDYGSSATTTTDIGGNWNTKASPLRVSLKGAARHNSDNIATARRGVQASKECAKHTARKV
jgi:hypothetical protein